MNVCKLMIEKGMDKKSSLKVAHHHRILVSATQNILNKHITKAIQINRKEGGNL